MTSRELLDPFAIFVDDAQSFTLSSVSIQSLVSITDIRRLNPALDTYGIMEPLPAGTVVSLPPVLELHGDPYGTYFTIGPMEEAIRLLDVKLDALLEQEESNLPQLPARRVISKTERIVTAVREESERQLARILEEYIETGERPALLQFLVDVEPVKRLREQLEAEYDGCHLQLNSLESGNSKLFSREVERHCENAVTESSRHNVRDTSEDFCLEEHSHRWEFTFMMPESSSEVQDTWAVLSCQTLGALFDTFECRNCLPYNMSKNAFLFIGGTFYVDNRHAGVEGGGYDDLTFPIRQFQPVPDDSIVEEGAGNLAFGRCPVKYVSQTTFAHLNLRLGEFGVLRHIGWCSHYFYLSSVESLRGLDPCHRERGDYPQRVMKVPMRVVRCRMCRQFPATVACFNDELSPENPCPYCVPCFELLHATDEGVVEEDKYITIRLPDGKCFTL